VGARKGAAMKLRILGAAGEVTGSNHMIDTKEFKVLVDCGFHQGQDEEKHEGEAFTYNPADIDALLLTHAHIDHSGRIPLLVKQGFRGKIFCTEATAELVPILWQDSAKLMEEEAQWRSRKNSRKGLPKSEPLYGIKETESAIKLLQPVKYDETIDIVPGLKARFRVAGHILGSASIETWITEDGCDPVKVVFSGDLGPLEGVIEKPPVTIDDADFVLIESTYGDRLHKSLEDTRSEFQNVIKTALKTSGKILIPSFVIDRAQRILYELDLFEKTFPELKIPTTYLDSPMGVKATEIYAKYSDLLMPHLKDMLEAGDDPFEPNDFRFIRTADESRAVNELKSGIILAGSGMCTGGRIMHHLKHNLFKLDTQIIFVGYQATGTVGRRIVNGAKSIRIAGEDIAVRAQINTIGGFSAHADRDDLLKWASSMPKKTRFIVVHGEPESSESLALGLKDSGYSATVPAFGDSFDLLAPAAETAQMPVISPDMSRRGTETQGVELALADIMTCAAELQKKHVASSEAEGKILSLLTSAKTLLETAEELGKKTEKYA
jgi:metallo-beta-lactamase family protein